MLFILLLKYIDDIDYCNLCYNSIAIHKTIVQSINIVYEAFWSGITRGYTILELEILFI